jgi:hypothetical protein
LVDDLTHISEIMDDCIHDLVAKKSAEKQGQAATACVYNGGHGRLFLMASLAVKVCKVLFRLLTKKKFSPKKTNNNLNDKTSHTLKTACVKVYPGLF